MNGVTGANLRVRKAWPRGNLNHPRRAPTAFWRREPPLHPSRLSGSESGESSVVPNGHNRTAALCDFRLKR